MAGIAIASVSLAIAVLLLFGLHRLWLLWISQRRGKEWFDIPTGPLGDEPPLVTVQLPIYNERLVAERLIRAAARIEYPRDRMEIQVLDDSTDDTSGIIANTISEIRREGGPPIFQLRRADRAGFKAGALAEGLLRARGELIAVFDADFVPPSDFLIRAVPRFQDPAVGMLQARWGFLNEGESLLTRAQAVSLRAHFHIEQRARYLSDRFFHFNGTAGIWRRAAVEDAGGWEGDTLTEDLDLSYRAQMRGWRFAYLDDLVCPSELPPTFQAFKTQQHRWMKGTAEVARKVLPRLLASNLPMRVKIEAVAHLLSPLAYAGSLLSFLAGPVILLSAPLLPAPLLRLYQAALSGVLGILVLYHLAAERGTGSWRGPVEFARDFLALVLVGAGNSLTGTRAYLEGLLGFRSPFIRTPKYAGRRSGSWYRLRLDRWIVAESILGLYALGFAWTAARAGAPLLFWAAIFLAGWAYAVSSQVAEAIRSRG